MADQMADQTYDRWQFPDPPGNYPAPVSFVLWKLEMVRSELVRMINEGSALTGVVMSVNGKAPDESKNVSLAAADVPATEKVNGVDVQTTVQARLDVTASEITTHIDDKTTNPHNVTAEQTGARSLADLAVYEEKDGEVEKTEDELVKKSEVGGIVTAQEYSDLWDLDNGETVRLYFAWNDDTQEWLLSNIEGWNGRDAPPSYPVYWTGVSDTDVAFVTLSYLAKESDTVDPVSLRATRQLKNALGLAFVGDNVSEFANDAGYLKDDDLAGIRGPVVSKESVSSGDSLRVIRPDNETDVFKASADYGLEVRSYSDNTLCFRVDSGNADKADADHWYGSGAVEAYKQLTCYSGLNNLDGGSIRWNGGPAVFDQLWISTDSKIGGIAAKEEADVYVNCASGETKEAVFKCNTTFGGGFTVQFDENEARFTGSELDDDDENKAGFIGMDSEAQHSDVRNRFVVGAVATDLVLKVKDETLVLTESRLQTLSSVLDDYEAANKDLEAIA